MLPAEVGQGDRLLSAWCQRQVSLGDALAPRFSMIRTFRWRICCLSARCLIFPSAGCALSSVRAGIGLVAGGREVGIASRAGEDHLNEVCRSAVCVRSCGVMCWLDGRRVAGGSREQLSLPRVPRAVLLIGVRRGSEQSRP